ncbi:MAG: T9SS type A sorting domain-containing protein [Flavobacteriales bacterium]
MKKIITTTLASALFALVSQAQTGHDFYVQDMSNQGYEPFSSINVQEGDVIRFYNGAGGTYNFEVVDQNNQPNFEVPGVPANQEIYSVTIDANYPSYSTITVSEYVFSPSVIKDVEINFSPSTTSVGEVESSINIYPNPANNFLRIDSEHPVREAVIQNAEGKLIQLQDVSNTIDISSLPTGAYIVRCTLNDDKVITKKFIKN